MSLLLNNLFLKLQLGVLLEVFSLKNKAAVSYVKKGLIRMRREWILALNALPNLPPIIEAQMQKTTVSFKDFKLLDQASMVCN